MTVSIDRLVAAGDVEGLYAIMAEHRNWMTQLDAAEGLLKLRDPRGLEFLTSAEHSDDPEVREVVREILASPEGREALDEIRAEAEERRIHQVEIARQRLAKGKRVFSYRMLYLPAGELLNEDPLSRGYPLPALQEMGCQGWEVIHVLPRRRQLVTDGVDGHFTGAYFLLQRELASDEADQLK